MFDKPTGLQNNLNRWYDPLVGRWLSQDPIGFDADDANLYRYVRNSPAYATDSSGLESEYTNESNRDIPVYESSLMGAPIPIVSWFSYTQYVKGNFTLNKFERTQVLKTVTIENNTDHEIKKKITGEALVGTYVLTPLEVTGRSPNDQNWGRDTVYNKLSLHVPKRNAKPKEQNYEFEFVVGPRQTLKFKVLQMGIRFTLSGSAEWRKKDALGDHLFYSISASAKWYVFGGPFPSAPEIISNPGPQPPNGVPQPPNPGQQPPNGVPQPPNPGQQPPNGVPQPPNPGPQPQSGP